MDDQTDNAQENGAGIRPAEQLSAPLIDICRSARLQAYSVPVYLGTVHARHSDAWRQADRRDPSDLCRVAPQLREDHPGPGLGIEAGEPRGGIDELAEDPRRQDPQNGRTPLSNDLGNGDPWH